MNQTARSTSSFILLAYLLFSCLCSNASAASDKIPKELKPWIPWVLYEQEKQLCSPDSENRNSRYCAWPSSLTLDVTDKGATFSQQWLIETRIAIPLPGNVPFWPKQVQINGEDALLSKKNNQPWLWLETGTHTVTGSFTWNELPEYLFIPPATGLVTLSVQGKQVPHIQLDEQGKIWFKQKKQKIKNDEESLSLQVFRKIEDGIPLLQHLHIQLTVSGSPRQVALGLKIDPNFIPLAIESPLPVRFDKQKRLLLQIRPGQWNISLLLRNTLSRPPASIDRGDINGSWPDQEIWVFAADPKLRQVEIKGVVAVDPSRTSLPDEWKRLPAYLMQGNSKMTILEKNRGNPSPVPNRLSLHRKLWLDEGGHGLTVLDTISGTMTSGWRLNVSPTQELGRVEVEGVPRLITRLEESEKTGVEVRKGKLSLSAVSRIMEGVSTGHLVIPAIGWDHNVHQLSAELNLPPGWKLLSTTGADRIPTWLNKWTLFDIFLVLITALATGRILGSGWGIAALITLVLCFHQPGSPRYLWLPLLAILGIRQISMKKIAEQLTRYGGFAILAVIILSSIPYMVHEIRTGIFPQLEYGKYKTIHSGGGSVPHYEMDAVEEEAMLTAQSVEIRKTGKMESARSLYGLRKARKASPPAPAPKRIEIDPQEMIQTGPGLPDWNWTNIRIHWNGPVKPTQEISFFLLPPLTGTMLAFLRVAILTLLLFGFMRKCAHSRKSTKTSTAVKRSILLACILFSSILSPPGSNAEVPSPEILQELQDRLLAPAKCANHCVSINQCLLTIQEEQLKITFHIDSQVRSGISLPGKNRFFDTIRLDENTSPVLLVNDKGFSTIRLDQGSHTISLTKNIDGINKLSLVFPVLPSHTDATLLGWSINGMRSDGRLARQISLERIKVSTRQEAETQENNIHIPAFVRVERTLHMNLKWTVTTRIIRQSPAGVIALSIPLLPGEHVTSDSFHIANKQIRITMGPNQQIASFQSTISPVDILSLKAKKTTLWNEIWFLDVSPIWHVQTSGLPAINQTSPEGRRFPEYHPYPGESLKLAITRPDAVPGATMTISKSKLLVKPGRRTSETTLTFSLTASRGMQHDITLPPGIDLQKTEINQKEMPLQLVDNRLTLPLVPGQQHVSISWRSEQELQYKTETESIDLGAESINSSIEMQVPASRWILLAGGPQTGPAVLFWGELLVIILCALVLGRITLTPLSTLQWLLLSLGLSQIPITMAAIVVVWLLLLGVRKKHGLEIKQGIFFNLLQVLLVLLTLAALALLFFAIQQGLLGHPDMQIGGNGSSGRILHWYQDRTGSILPVAWVVTVPLLVYRISMLLWALWLAMALLRWIRWGWNCFSSGTTWKMAPAKKKRSPKIKAKAAAPAKRVVKKSATKVTPKKEKQVIV